MTGNHTLESIGQNIRNPRFFRHFQSESTILQNQTFSRLQFGLLAFSSFTRLQNCRRGVSAMCSLVLHPSCAQTERKRPTLGKKQTCNTSTCVKTPAKHLSTNKFHQGARPKLRCCHTSFHGTGGATQSRPLQKPSCHSAGKIRHHTSTPLHCLK